MLQEKDDIARELQQSRRLNNTAAYEYKRKSAPYLTAQETIERLNSKGIHYRNEFVLEKLLPKGKEERLCDFMA